MCGICGIAVLNTALEPDVDQRMADMVKILAHRGPNETGIANSKAAAFGIARLSIRGVNDGTQPIIDKETGVMVVCNGEIDNHPSLREQLKGRGRKISMATDVAVILPLYLEFGEDFINRLQGAFAIAIWDPRSKTLLLARDRVGERPLFYAQRGNEVSFASLVSALAAPDKRHELVCVPALHGFLQRGYFAAPETPFQSIHKIFPGEIVRFTALGIQRSNYWRWGITAVRKQTANIDVFDSIFRDAVDKQSNVDVDFGLFLSGGLDSSLVAAVAKSLHPDKTLSAFCLRFSEKSYDEGQYAERVAEKLGLNLVSVWVHPEELPRKLECLIGQVGEPLADPAWVPTALLAERASQDVRMALVGEGADELFAGYPTYFGAGFADRYNRLPAKLRALFRWGVESWPCNDKKMTLVFLLKRFVQGDNLDYMSRHQLWTSSISPELLVRLGLQPAFNVHNVNAMQNGLDYIQLHDLENSLAEGLLTKADRGSMKSAVELRAPFLHEDVMQFATGLPEMQRVKGVQTKVFLKQYALRYLPREIVHRKKRGLSVPLNSWLRGPLYHWAKTRLRNPLLAEVGVDIYAASEILEEHRLRNRDHARGIWTLVVLSEWLKWKSDPNAS